MSSLYDNNFVVLGPNISTVKVRPTRLSHCLSYNKTYSYEQLTSTLVNFDCFILYTVLSM